MVHAFHFLTVRLISRKLKHSGVFGHSWIVNAKLTANSLSSIFFACFICQVQSSHSCAVYLKVIISVQSRSSNEREYSLANRLLAHTFMLLFYATAKKFSLRFCCWCCWSHQAEEWISGKKYALLFPFTLWVEKLVYYIFSSFLQLCVAQKKKALFRFLLINTSSLPKWNECFWW